MENASLKIGTKVAKSCYKCEMQWLCNAFPKCKTHVILKDSLLRNPKYAM